MYNDWNQNHKLFLLIKLGGTAFCYRGAKMIELVPVLSFQIIKICKDQWKHYVDFSADSSMVDELTEKPSRKSLSESSCSSLNMAMTCIMVGLLLGRSCKHSQAIYRY
jgi:hypothetical protein